MSILIKGIEKPEYGYIEIHLYDNRAECEFQEHIYTDLEIEEVPEPHGRLIDVDKLKAMMEERHKRLKDDDSIWEESVVDVFLDDAPTVIEAEDQK